MFSLGGGFQNFYQIRMRTVLLIAVYAGFHFFSRKGVGNKDDPVINPANAVPLVGQVVNGELYLLVIGKGDRYEFAGRGVHGVNLP